ncbi:MAG: hypothetical protein L0219_22770 [Phycisphaerales bacterium]|nr:hypothetical protein [Phycisphaerales bacterium]
MRYALRGRTLVEVAVVAGAMLLVCQGSGSVVHQPCVSFSGTCDCPSGKCDCFGGWPCYSLAWDIDSSGTIDFCYYPGQDCPSGCTITLAGDVAWPVDEGAIIGPDLKWTSGVNWLSDAGGCYSGPGCDGSGPYVGLRFTDESGAHYGWTLGPLGPYAYETAVETPIAAGAGVAVAGDVSGDGTVDVTDLLLLIVAWGECPWCCPADLAPAPEGDGFVDVDDLLMVISNWS